MSNGNNNFKFKCICKVQVSQNRCAFSLKIKYIYKKNPCGSLETPFGSAHSSIHTWAARNHWSGVRLSGWGFKAELKPVNMNIPVQHISNPPPFSLCSCINCDNLHQCRDRKATGSLLNGMMLFKHEVEEGCFDNGAEPLLMALLGLLTERLV